MEPEARFVAIDSFWAAPATGNGLVLFFELRSGLSEGLSNLKLAVPLFRAKLEIPILGNVLSARKAALLRTFAPLLTVQVR